MSRPQASKVVHLCVSVGKDDTNTLDEFETQLKACIQYDEATRSLVTVVGATYVHDGKTYRKPDWEAWDGSEATKPRAMFDHSGGPPVVERTVSEVQPKSPREALDGIRRTQKRRRALEVLDTVEPVKDDGPAPKHTKRTGNDRKNDAIDDREVTDIEGVDVIRDYVEVDDEDWGSW